MLAPDGPIGQEEGMQAFKRPGWSAAPSRVEVLGASAVIAGATALGLALRSVSPDPAWLFLAGVLVNAAAWGFWLGLISAALAFFALNFLFVEPLYTFRVTDLADLIRLAQFLGLAALTGFLAGRLREEAAEAKARARVVTTLSALSEAGSGGRDAVLQALARALAELAGPPSAVLGDDLQVLASLGPKPGAAEFAAAERAQRLGRREEAVAAGWDGARMVFQPLPGTDLVAGHAPVDQRRRDAGLLDEALSLACASGAQALAALTLAEAAATAERKAEAESLRAVLLSSVSHDLRTPLATILGAASTLRELGAEMDAPARADLVAAIEEEAGRLSRQVENLLQMTRLQVGIALRPSPLDLAEVVEVVRARAVRSFPAARFAVKAGPVPLIQGEAQLIEQALFNLVENAVKHGRPDGTVTIALTGETEVKISVTDTGPGIPKDRQSALFQPFFRGDGRPAGFGLGLSIAEGVVRAHGGRIQADSPVQDGHGTRVTLILPKGAGA